MFQQYIESIMQKINKIDPAILSQFKQQLQQEHSALSS